MESSLGDFIRKKNSENESGARSRGRSNGFIGKSRGFGRGNTRGRGNFAKSRKYTQQLPDKWTRGAGNVDSVVVSSYRLLVTNLKYSVTDSDLKELFSSYPGFKKATLHFDQTGRSTGVAEVVFNDEKMAANAMNQLKGHYLDDRALVIQMLDAPGATKTSISRLRLTTENKRGTFNGRGNGFRSGRGGFRGRSNREQSARSKEQLDSDLMTYHNDAQYQL